MKKIGKLTGKQAREIAILIKNKTGLNQPDKLFFVQLDDYYSVDNRGSIFQIINKSDIEDCNTLIYKGEETGNIYNYSEDKPNFEADSEDLEIYNHCAEQAYLLNEDIYNQ